MTLSHTSALRAVRLADYPELLKSWDCATSWLPEKPPTVAERKRLAEETPFWETLGRPLHVLVSSDRCAHSSSGLCRHVSTQTYPEGSFNQIGDDLFASSPAMILFQLARKADRIQLALLMSEFAGLYSLGEEGGDMLQRKEPILDLVELRELATRHRRLHGTRKVLAAIDLACSNSGSPMESKLALRIKASEDLGGWDTPFVSMNEEVGLRELGKSLDEREVRKPDIIFLNRLGSRDSKGLPFKGIAFEYQGEYHFEPDQAKADMIRSNNFLAAGIKEYQIFKSMYDDLDYMDDLIKRVRIDLGLPVDYLRKGAKARRALYDALETVDLHNFE